MSFASVNVEALLARTAEAIYVLNAQRRIIAFNRVAQQLAGFSSADVLGRQCQYHTPLGGDALAGLLGSLCPPPEVFEGRALEVLTEIPTREGPTKTCRAAFRPFHDERGTLLFVWATLAPITTTVSRTPLPLVGRGGGGEGEAQPHTDDTPDLHHALQRLRARVLARYGFDRIVGATPAMARVLARARLAAATAAAVLIRGASGTGKDLIARTIYYGGPRAGEPLVPIDCGLLPPEAVERTLRRALRLPPEGDDSLFTLDSRLSTPPLECGGLLINEVALLPRDAQALLAAHLGKFESRERRDESSQAPVARSPLSTLDSRLSSLLSGLCPFPSVIATTSSDPAEAVAAGALRADLYYAVSAITIDLPPLAERAGDIPLLAQHFVEQANARGERQLSTIAPETMDLLLAYPWPGNVGELAETIAAAHARASSTVLQAADLPPRFRSALAALAGGRPADEAKPPALADRLADVERNLIRDALRTARGNKSKAAALLGLTRPRLYRRILQLGLEEPPAGAS